jgi:hypothetical protein
MMSLSKPSLLSKSHLFISQFRRPRIHVCGLLGTYDIEDFPTSDDDYWMAIDLVAIRELIGACDDTSIWLCGTPIRRGRPFLLGDPDCDRIAFNPPPFETLLSAEPNGLAIKFLIEVTKKSERLSAGETLVIVLVGHGEDDHSFIVGGDGRQNCKIHQEQLENSVGHAKGNILVIITACYSGSWTSPHWTLLAATGPGEEAPSIVVSGSGECRGSFFTNALLAEHASKFNIRPPCPGIMDNRGFRHPQKDHNFGPEKIIHPVTLQPQCSLQEVMNWIHKFRDDIGHGYTSANVTFHSCRKGHHHLPFASLISATTPFHELQCVLPSPPSNHASIHSASMHCWCTVISSLQIVQEETLRKLSEKEEGELLDLSANFLCFMPPSTPSEKSTIGHCWVIIYRPANGFEPLSDSEQSKLFLDLKNRMQRRELALAIAKSLGWSKGIREVGRPGGKQTQMGPMIALQREAEASGCLVSVLHIPTSHAPWGNAAGWLARVWEAEGCPVVSPEEWAMAVEQGSATNSFLTEGFIRK